MHIRPLEGGEEERVVAIWRAAGLLVNPLNDPFADIAFARGSGHGDVLVGLEGERIVCAVMVGHDGHRGWMYYVGVDPAAQGRGFGRHIVRGAERWLAARSVPKVEALVRDTNVRVIGFYQRLGYQHEPREVLSRRLDGVPVTMGSRTSDDPVIITFLEMREKPVLPRVEPAVGGPLALLRARRPSVHFYRYLYDAVGRPWYWTDRKRLDDATLAGIIQNPDVDVYVLYVVGGPAGLAELDRRTPDVVDLAYFGIMPEYIGQRLGPYLLARAIELAWSAAPHRVTVNTCTLDHPKALPMYQRFGFRPYARREVPPPWQRGVAELDD